MARTTKQLSGGGKDKFLRALIASEPSLPHDAAVRLSETFSTAIADIRVRRDAWEASKHDGAAVAVLSATAPTPSADFDPFAFSALAVLTKQGAKALSDRLSAVASVNDLRALANAQHLSVDAGLTDPALLRAAILSATEARLAERRAAAS